MSAMRALRTYGSVKPVLMTQQNIDVDGTYYVLMERRHCYGRKFRWLSRPLFRGAEYAPGLVKIEND